jgi:hypothetical protein
MNDKLGKRRFWVEVTMSDGSDFGFEVCEFTEVEAEASAMQRAREQGCQPASAIATDNEAANTAEAYHLLKLKFHKLWECYKDRSDELADAQNDLQCKADDTITPESILDSLERDLVMNEDKHGCCYAMKSEIDDFIMSKRIDLENRWKPGDKPLYEWGVDDEWDNHCQ